eukprot:358651-Chlamydomonas_euryale.AAC.5
MQHNPYEIRQPGRPPGGLYRARQCASSFFCPPLHAIALPDLLLAAAVAAAPDSRGRLRRGIGNAPDALACGWVDCLEAFRPAKPAKFYNLKACAPAAQPIPALNDRFWSHRRLNKRV